MHTYIYIYMYIYIYIERERVPVTDYGCPERGDLCCTGRQDCQVVFSSGSQRTTTTNEPLPLCPVSKRAGMTRFVESQLVTACLVTRLQLAVGEIFNPPLINNILQHVWYL